MILNTETYWKVLEYIFNNLHFIEEYTNPSEMINVETSVDEKCVWLGSIMKEYESEKCPREAILTIIHMLLMRDLIKVIYAAPKKDYRIIDLTSKGYEELLRHNKVIQ